MPYNFVADNFHTKKLCSRLHSSEVRFYTENGRFAVLSLFGGIGATYDDHLSLIVERVVDLRLRRYERVSVQNRRFRSNGGRLIQIFR